MALVNVRKQLNNLTRPHGRRRLAGLALFMGAIMVFLGTAPIVFAGADKEVEFSACQIQRGSGSCSFDCAPGLRIQAEHEGKRGTVQATCGSTVVASCPQAPCTDEGTSPVLATSGVCEASGISGTATCRAVAIGTASSIPYVVWNKWLLVLRQIGLASD